MKIALFAALFSFCGMTLHAQAPAQPDKDKAAAAARPAAQAKPAAQPAKAAAPAPAKKAAKPEAAAAKVEADGEESMVMIDSKTEPEDTGRFAADYGQGQEDADAAGGIPSSYGQCKGVVNDGGRNLLVFESPDDGTLSFVQVTAGKGKFSWKLVDRIRRSAD